MVTGGPASGRHRKRVSPLAELPLWAAVAAFLAAAAVISVAGVRMAETADRLADRTGVGGALFGGYCWAAAPRYPVSSHRPPPRHKAMRNWRSATPLVGSQRRPSSWQSRTPFIVAPDLVRADARCQITAIRTWRRYRVRPRLVRQPRYPPPPPSWARRWAAHPGSFLSRPPGGSSAASCGRAHRAP